jgi:hypothetical protein
LEHNASTNYGTAYPREKGTREKLQKNIMITGNNKEMIKMEKGKKNKKRIKKQ